MAEFHSDIIDYLFRKLSNSDFKCFKEHKLWYMGKGNKRVDMVAYKDRRIYCFEIKTYREDIASGYGCNYVGNFNYLVVPEEIINNATEYIKDNYSYSGILKFDKYNRFIEIKSPLYIPTNNQIFFNMYVRQKIGEITKSDMAKVMGVSRVTLDRYIKDYENYLDS